MEKAATQQPLQPRERAQQRERGKPKPAIARSPEHSPTSLKSLTPSHTNLQAVPSPELWAVMSAMSPVDDEHDEYVSDVGLVSWERMDQLMKTPEYAARGGL